MLDYLRYLSPTFLCKKACYAIPWCKCFKKVSWLECVKGSVHVPCCPCGQKTDELAAVVEKVRDKDYKSLAKDMLATDAGKQTVYLFKKKWMDSGKLPPILNFSETKGELNAGEKLIDASKSPDARRKIVEKLVQDEADGEKLNIVKIKIEETVPEPTEDENGASGVPEKQEANVVI